MLNGVSVEKKYTKTFLKVFLFYKQSIIFELNIIIFIFCYHFLDIFY